MIQMNKMKTKWHNRMISLEEISETEGKIEESIKEKLIRIILLKTTDEEKDILFRHIFHRESFRSLGKTLNKHHATIKKIFFRTCDKIRNYYYG